MIAQSGVDGLLNVIFKISGANAGQSPPAALETRNPWKPSSPFSTSVSRYLLPCIFWSVPTAVGNHDGADVGLDRRRRGAQIMFPQRGFIANGVALGQCPWLCRASSMKMFRAGENGKLDLLNRRFCPEIPAPPPAEFGKRFWRSTIPFVGVSPTFILHHGAMHGANAQRMPVPGDFRRSRRARQALDELSDHASRLMPDVMRKM